MSLSYEGAALGLTLLQGGLVALPRPEALTALGRLRSPAWAAVLPGSIVLGTFGPLAAPSTTLWLPVLAALAAPPLALVAALAVVRGPRGLPLALALAAMALALITGGVTGELSATVLTALACLALGAALARLIPARWMLIGVLSMAVADVAFLASGAGQPAAALIVSATAPHGAVFDSVRLGQLTLDYPDLVLAATLGAFLADRRGQRRGAALVAAVAAGCFVLTPAGSIWPATVPIAVALLALRTFPSGRFVTRSTRGAGSPDVAGA